MDIYHKILKQYWGYDHFRPLQQDIIHSVCDGKDTLGLMPTGGGKSLTFQVPAMAMDGLCLVVTPLIALMKDQVDNLWQRGIKALAVYSGMTRQEIITTLENAILGDYKFLYVSPERLATDLFISKLKEMNICLLAVDEAHCISQWGYDFRPSYTRIAEVRQYIPQVPVLALTATATPDVVKDIQVQLLFARENVFKKSFYRNNLSYVVRETEDKEASLINMLEKVKGTAIVYVRNRQRTKEIAEKLARSGFSADHYHAGLTATDKTKKQNAWKQDQLRIIVCTNAFGMGIDKPDVRLVVHFDLPNSVEEYFQEAGRAGRDEKRAYATILYTKTDTGKLKKRIADEFPDRDFIIRIYEVLAYYFQVAEGFGMDTTFDFNLHHFCSVYKVPLLTAHNALKILDLAGYINYIDEVDNRSRLIFTVYRDELYHYQFDKEYEQLINVVLRLYTGLFTNYITIHEGEIAQRLGTTQKSVYEALKMLSKRGIVDYIPHKKTPLITYTLPRIDKKYLSIPRTVYEDRKERFEARVHAFVNYVSRNDVCRSRILLSYFGESEATDCGHCDVCKAKNDSGLTNKRFNDISLIIKRMLSGGELSLQTVIDQMSDYQAKDVSTVVRFLISRGELLSYMDRIRLNEES